MVRAYTGYGRGKGFTPQSQPIPGRTDMVRNNAGGFGFEISPWKQLNRFLILASEGGTYYVKQEALTELNAQAVIRCIKEDGIRVIAQAQDVNVNNRSPKTDAQLFVLALAMKHGDLRTKNAVRLAAPQMLRTGTHVLHLAAMLDSLGGWSRSKRRLMRNWMRDNDAENVAYQVLKYRSRDGWSMRDILRVSHPKAPSLPHAATYDWVCGRTRLADQWPRILVSNAIMNLAIEETGVAAVLKGLEQHIPREAIPTEFLGQVPVQQALLPFAGLHQLLRNLGAWTASGALATGTEHTQLVAERLRSEAGLRKAKVHPFQVMLAAMTYLIGHGIRGAKTWVPVQEIQEALDDAFELSWGWQQPHGKRILIAIDISGSMRSTTTVGTPMPCCAAASALALALARAEPFAVVIEADTEFDRVVPITKRSSLSNLTIHNGGGTDLTAAVRWATGSNRQFDAIVLLTDNETWAGRMHNNEALELYRRTVAPNCKLVVAAMAANHASVVDPTDPRQLGCAGLDSNLPSIINNFISE